MRIYRYSSSTNELFLVDNQLCAHEIVDYLIEPENNLEIAKVMEALLKLVDKGIHIYSTNFSATKVGKIGGEVILFNRPMCVIQLTKGDNRQEIETFLKELIKQ